MGRLRNDGLLPETNILGKHMYKVNGDTEKSWEIKDG